MSSQSDHSPGPALRAAELVQDFVENGDERSRSTLRAWCAESDEHYREFLFAVQTHTRLEGIRGSGLSYPVPGYSGELHRWLMAQLHELDTLDEPASVARDALASHGKKQPAPHPTTLLYSIVHEVISRQGLASAPRESPPGPDIAKAIDAAVVGLHTPFRNVLLMCNRDRRTYEEAATALDLGSEAVSKQLASGRAHVAVQLFDGLNSNDAALDRNLLFQSSEWIETLKRGDPADLAVFNEWLLASAQHIKHFLVMTALDQALRRIDRERRIPIELARQEATPASPAIDADEEAAWRGAGRFVRSRPKRPRAFNWPSFRPVHWWSLCALLLVLVIGAGIKVSPPAQDAGWQEFQTAAGEQQDSVVLPDGTLVTLNTRTRIAARISRDVREVELLEGEALFNVREDKGRPFQVHMGHGVVEALGTRFDVYYRSATGRVVVLEGSVSVAPKAQLEAARRAGRNSLPPSATRLSMGQRATVSASGDPTDISLLTDPALATAWTTGALIVDRMPLANLIDELNLYNPEQIRLEAPELSESTLSGTYYFRSAETVAQQIATTVGLVVVRVDGDLVLRKPQASGTDPELQTPSP
jgi:transmembrane sensor